MRCTPRNQSLASIGILKLATGQCFRAYPQAHENRFRFCIVQCAIDTLVKVVRGHCQISEQMRCIFPVRCNKMGDRPLML